MPIPLHVCVVIASLLDPLPSDVERFPPTAFVTRQIELLRAARHTVMYNADIDVRGRAQWLALLRRVESAEDCWRKLAQARDCYESCPVYAIQNLHDLRSMLGDAAYHAARMPGIPVWVSE